MLKSSFETLLHGYSICFKTSPEVIRLNEIVYIKDPLSLRSVEDFVQEPGIDLN